MWFRHKLLSTLLVVLGGLGAGTALAGPDSDKQGTDHDGKKFSKLDQNGDGALSQSELQQASMPGMDHELLDTDNDGQVDRTEFAAFERMNAGSRSRTSDYATEEHMSDDGGKDQQDPKSDESTSDY